MRNSRSKIPLFPTSTPRVVRPLRAALGGRKYRPLSASLGRYSSALAVLAAMAFVGVNPGKAATVFWDPDTNAANNVAGTQFGLGGAGTWNAGNLNWWNLAADNSWLTGNTANFGGVAGGLITMGAPISAGGL